MTKLTITKESGSTSSRTRCQVTLERSFQVLTGVLSMPGFCIQVDHTESEKSEIQIIPELEHRSVSRDDLKTGHFPSLG